MKRLLNYFKNSIHPGKSLWGRAGGIQWFSVPKTRSQTASFKSSIWVNKAFCKMTWKLKWTLFPQEHVSQFWTTHLELVYWNMKYLEVDHCFDNKNPKTTPKAVSENYREFIEVHQWTKLWVSRGKPEAKNSLSFAILTHLQFQSVSQESQSTYFKTPGIAVAPVAAPPPLADCPQSLLLLQNSHTDI